MVRKTKTLSALIERQLPEFISAEYPLFVKFLQKYYEQLENVGQPLDIINNLSHYGDIDNYENKILNESTTLTFALTETAQTISVLDTSSFPNENGYILIDEECIFYKTKTATSFQNCYRNISATTQLGDIYNSSTVKNVPASESGQGTLHINSSKVINISNLFLYAFVKNFETQYLSSFPEESLKPSVDKKTLIKNIKNFYQSKGTEQSIQFIFNSIVSQNAKDVPTVYYPKDKTLKPSNGTWIDKYALKVKVFSGNVNKLIGQKIYQQEGDKYSFAYVDNIFDIGTKDGENIYEIVLSEETVVGEFSVASKTFLTKNLTANASFENRVSVYSTSGWEKTFGEFLINNEIIKFKDKTINQFIIDSRQNSISYNTNTPVYSTNFVIGEYIENNIAYSVKLIPFGILYDLKVAAGKPYSSENDVIEITDTGFISLDPKVYDNTTGLSRWKINETHISPSLPQQIQVQTTLNEVQANISAVFEDDQYFYVTSSGFPDYEIGPFTKTSPQDQKHLKLIKKNAVTSTEINKTTTNDVGILVNGVPIYGYKDEEIIRYGEVISVEVTNQGTGYKNAPYIIFENSNGVSAVGKAVLSGQVVEKIKIENPGTLYTLNPSITISSGRNAVVNAIVTSGRVTSLVVANSGEYYSSAPDVIISDGLGRGRRAEYNSVISSDGKLIGFEKIEEGRSYTQENISVEIVPQGKGASATCKVKEWQKNRFKKLENSLDSNFGQYFDNRDISLGYGYAQIANPKKLRIQLGDNLTQTGSIPVTKVHSKIIGFAYDGNPIYGPWGYSNPLNPSSAVSRMTSSYSLMSNRINGPSTSEYPLGTFIQDYQYTHRSGSLDENNGRFCVTPEYPNGTYAYFITISDGINATSEGVPAFPYVIGENFYNIPVDSNYNKKISQNNTPKNITRWKTQLTPNNGVESFATIESVKSGTVDTVVVESSPNIFSNNSVVYFNNNNTEGSGATAVVSSINGKNVLSLESKVAKIVKINTIGDCYLFDGSTITQSSSNAQGTVIGNVFDSKTIVVKTTSGVFNSTNILNSSIIVNNLILDSSSNYTKGSIVVLTNGNQSPIERISSGFFEVSNNPYVNGDRITFNNSYGSIQANRIYYVRDKENFKFKIASTQNGSAISIADTNSPGIISFSEVGRGEVIDTTLLSNSVKIKVTSGSFSPISGFYLRSSNIADSIGSDVIQKNDLSQNILVSSLTDKVALIKTSENHGLSINDEVNVSINPNNSTTTTTYYVRKRIYQDLFLSPPDFQTTVNDNGVGSGRTLNGGENYANNGGAVYTNVELVFADQTKCRDILGNIVGSSSSKAVLGNPGGIEPNPNNARATINVVAGKVSSVTITYKGNGYKRGDLLTVSNSSLQRLPSSTSTRYFLFEVIHVGFSIGESVLKLSNVDTLSVNDTLSIGTEIVKISSVDRTSSSVSVVRAQFNTTQTNHYNQTLVELYEKKYNFQPGYIVGNGIVVSYNSTTFQLSIVYGINDNLSSISAFNLSSVLTDQSVPSKAASVKEFDAAEYKFEFSKDQSNWSKNPIIDIQTYYNYKFDTSNSSLLGSYFEISPSGNLNIITTETQKSDAFPGSSNSFITIKLGYGSAISSNLYSTKTFVNYSNFYYYDKSGIVKSDNSYLRVTADPLQGKQKIIYTTPNYFLYELPVYGQYDGSGTISYTTTSKTSVGSINFIEIIDKGSNYKKIPVVYGISPNLSTEAIVDVIWNNVNKNIESISIINSGKNYVKPKIVIISENGDGSEFDVTVNQDGSINGIRVLQRGKNYTSKPTAKVVESSFVSYCESSSIGVPKTVKISYNGSNFDNNQTTRRKFKSATFLKLSNYTETSFVGGEEVTQYVGSTITAKGIVSLDGWKAGSNILKISKTTFGTFKENLTIKGNIRNQTAVVKEIFVSLFTPTIKSYYDNLGYYSSSTGKIGESEHRLTDSYFYQDFSYVIKSQTPINVWRKLIQSTIHPAGFKLFGEVEISSEGNSSFVELPKSSSISIVQLWDPTKNKITVENTTFNGLNSKIVDVNTSIVKGQGSVIVPAFSTNEITAYEVILSSPFNGSFDESGNRQGITSFTMKIKGSNTNLTVDNVHNLIITVDGVLQNPGVSYTISGSTITFAEAPLGYRDSKGESVSLSNYKVGVDTPPQIFVGRYLKFKNLIENQTYFKKIKDISRNSNNRYLDASNLIAANKDFIVSESVGYLKFKNANTFINEEYYTDIISTYVDSIYHDIRYGGNSDVIQFSNILSGTNDSLRTRNFEQIANIAGQNFKSIVTNGVITIAVTESGRIYTTTSISSPFTWTQRSYTSPVTKLNKILLLNGIFVIVGKGIIITSLNGTTWTVVSRHNDDLYSAAFSEVNGYIAVGQDRIYYTSANTITWEQNEIYELNPLDTDYPILNDDGLISTINLNDVIQYNDIFIVSGDSGNFYITENFADWTIVETSNYYGDIVSIVKNANTLIAVTETGYSLKSTNGYNWKSFNVSLEENRDYIISGITYVGNEYLITSSSSESLKTNIFGSINGELWYPITQFTIAPVLTDTLNLPYYINGNLYVGSSTGKIYKAPNPNASGSLPSTTLDILKYSRNLMIAAIRNWDVVIEFARTNNGSSLVTIGNTANIVIGMRVVGKGIPTATFVREIISDTQFRLGNLSRTAYKNATFTSTISNSTLLYFSLNSLGNDPGHTRDTGVFLDAARQIEINRQFIQQEAYGWALNSYPSLSTTPGIDISKCQRDIGYILDAYVYDLKFGGNTKIIEAAESYYIGNTLSYINNQKTQSIETFRKATELAKLAMRNWGGSNFVREFTNPANFANENVVGVTANTTIRVAVTQSGKIYTSSPSSMNWSQRSYSGGVREFTGIKYINDIFWIMSKGAILYSYNGTNWFVRLLSGNDSVRSIAFTQNSGYIAVCDNRVYYTSFDGNLWNYSEIYDANPLDTDYPYLSEDGEYLITDLNDVIYPSFISNLCLIAGDNGRFYTSTNLVDWQIITTSEFYGDIVSVTEVSGTLLAVTSNGYSLKSTNGTTWIKYNITAESQRDYRLSGHVWVENEYIAFGSYSNLLQTSIFASVDGQTWYALTLNDFSVSPNLNDTFNTPYFGNNIVLVGTESGAVYRAKIPLYEKQYASLDYIRNLNIRLDSNTGTDLSCAGVATAIDTYFSIFENIINDGINKISVSKEYSNPSGAFTNLSTYPNYNITQDYTYPECSDVASSIFTLYSIISEGYTEVTLPSYFDGKNTRFKLYYDDGSEVNSETFDNLIVGLDGVLQRAGITPLIPKTRAYYINRMTIPNEIVFVEPPKSFDSDNYQKFFAYSIGKYELLTIIPKFNKTSGPFNIISSLTERTSIISDDRYVLVFVDGILQRRNESYTISNSLIYFNEPLEPTANVYIIYWYGLNYVKTLFLYGQSKPDAIFQPTEFDSTPLNAKYDVFLGDLIRVQGEKDFRKVLSDPYNFEKTEYRTQDNTNVTYSAEVKVTNYNEDAFGNGLDVQSTVQGGKVTDLMWNKKDYSIQYPQPNNYGYEETPLLTFVSQPEYDSTGTIIAEPQGGGAKGYAIMAGGEVIDIVLLDGGSGYVIPPKIYITKRFDVYKSNTRKAPTELFLNYEPAAVVTEGLITSSVCTLILATVQTVPQITSLPLVSPALPVKQNFEIIILVNPEITIVSDITSHSDAAIILEITSSPQESGDTIFTHETITESTSIINTLDNQDSPIVTISEIIKEIVSFQESGIIEYITEFSNNSYLSGQYGSTFESYQGFQMYDYGYAAVSDMEQTIENFTLYHPTVTVGDFSDRSSSFIDSTGKYLNAVTPSITEYGAILEIPLSETDTIVYISNTSRFPEAGIILVGDEVIKYTSKLSDRFLNCTRGYYGTIAKIHIGGDYLRTYRVEFKIPVYQNSNTTLYNTVIDTREIMPDMFRTYSSDVYTRTGSFTLI